MPTSPNIPDAIPSTDIDTSTDTNPDSTSPNKSKKSIDPDFPDWADLGGDDGGTGGSNTDSGSSSGTVPTRAGTDTPVPVASTTSSLTPTASKSPASNGLPPWAIAVIVVGSVVGAALLAGLAVFCVRRRKHKALRKEEEVEEERDRDAVYQARDAAYRKLEQVESSRAEDSDREGDIGGRVEMQGVVAPGRDVNAEADPNTHPSTPMPTPIRTRTFESVSVVSAPSLAPTTQLGRSSSVVSSLTSASSRSQGQDRYERLDPLPSPLSERSPETEGTPYVWREPDVPSIPRPGSTPGKRGSGA